MSVPGGGGPAVRAGFSLLEIVVVLALVALLMGGAIAVMVAATSDRQLRGMSTEIETMAKRARAVSLLQQTPYAVEFTWGRVRMLPLAEVGMEGKELIEAQAAVAAAEEQAGVPVEMRRRTPVRSEISVGGGVTLAIRRWGSEGFVPIADKRARMVWRFDPNGLCEPISVRLTQGANWIEDEYHPLTAAVRDSAMSIK